MIFWDRFCISKPELSTTTAGPNFGWSREGYGRRDLPDSSCVFQDVGIYRRLGDPELDFTPEIFEFSSRILPRILLRIFPEFLGSCRASFRGKLRPEKFHQNIWRAGKVTISRQEVGNRYTTWRRQFSSGCPHSRAPFNWSRCAQLLVNKGEPRARREMTP